MEKERLKTIYEGKAYGGPQSGQFLTNTIPFIGSSEGRGYVHYAQENIDSMASDLDLDPYDLPRDGVWVSGGLLGLSDERNFFAIYKAMQGASDGGT